MVQGILQVDNRLGYVQAFGTGSWPGSLMPGCPWQPAPAGVGQFWVTCQLSPHLTQAPWIHSSLEKTAAMYLQAEDKTVILV